MHIDVDPAAERKATQAIASGIDADDDEEWPIVGIVVSSVAERAPAPALSRAV
jgi:hypothetical protein